jgi:hypothetical protein
MEAIRFSETSVNKISTRSHIPEDGILLRLRMFEKRALGRIFGLKRLQKTA